MIMDKLRSNDNIEKPDRFLEVFLYVNAFVIGFIIMAFEMLGSRYLNPYFGGGIFTWASIISTVLMALAAGYFIGGYIADRKPSLNLLGIIIFIASAWLCLVPIFADPLFELMFNSIEDVRYGSLISAIFLLFIPLSLLGIYSPYAIRLMLKATKRSGTVSGTVYGISTLGSILGTLVTTFYLIPLIGTRRITYYIFICTLLCGLSFLVLAYFEKRKAIYRRADSLKTIPVILILVFSISSQTLADPPEDSISKTKKFLDSLTFFYPHKNDLVEKIETPYNNIFIYKNNNKVVMTFQYKIRNTVQSIMNLENPKELIAPYTRIMPVGVLYVDNPENILMLGLGGGIITRYIQRYYPSSDVKVVEIDKGVIEISKKYFKVKESEKYKIIESDARVYLKRNKEKYNIVMVDAFRTGNIPFHLLTKEFYEIVKEDIKEDGCLVMNLIRTTKLFDSNLKTLRSVFKSVDIYAHDGIVNAIIVAYDTPKLKDSDLYKKADILQREKDFYHDIREILLLKREIGLNREAKLLTDDFAPVNSYNNISRVK